AVPRGHAGGDPDPAEVVMPPGLPKAPPALTRLFGATASIDEGRRGFANVTYFGMGSDGEDRNFVDPQQPGQHPYEEKEHWTQAQRRWVNPEEAGRCHQEGCRRLLPDLGFQVFYCCRMRRCACRFAVGAPVGHPAG
ncbi:unnamed protein product, partial [Prorocentrum cordatum]